MTSWELEGPPGTWSSPTARQGVPGPDDCVTVRPAHLITVDQEVTIQCLLIQAQGAVDFGAPKTLSITHAGGLTIAFEDAAPNSPGTLAINHDDAVLALTGGGSHAIDGFLSIENAGARLTIAEIDVNISGTGDIVLGNPTGRIEVDAPHQCTIGESITIFGHGKVVRGTGTARAGFRNNGRIVATNNTLSFGPNILLDDDCASRWEANDGGRLQFEKSHVCPELLHGDFLVTNGGEIKALQGVRIDTTGNFTCSGIGSVTPGALFYNCSCDAQECEEAQGCG